MQAVSTINLQKELAGKIPLAIVLEGAPETWQMNVLQVLATPSSVQVVLDGYGTISATAFVLSPDQARHLATQITEQLGREHECRPRVSV